MGHIVGSHHHLQEVVRMLLPPTSSLPQDTMKRRSQEAPHQSSAAAIHARAIIPPSPSSHPASRSGERGQIVRPLVLQVIQGVLDKTVRYSHKAQGSHHPALDDPNGGVGKWRRTGEQSNRGSSLRKRGPFRDGGWPGGSLDGPWRRRGQKEGGNY